MFKMVYENGCLTIFEPDTPRLPKDKLRSQEDMKNLCKEYNESADRLEQRVKDLKALLAVMPLDERKIAERRIAILEQEIRESRRTGADAGSFYLPGHRFLPHQNKSAVYPGVYIC